MKLSRSKKGTVDDDENVENAPIEIRRDIVYVFYSPLDEIAILSFRCVLH